MSDYPSNRLNTSDLPPIGYGIKSIASFFGMPSAKAYHLASKGSLPGVFKFENSREWAIDYEIARAGIRDRARRVA